MSFLTASKRMLNQNGNTPKKGWSINNKYEAIVIGDAYCGKSTYLNMLAESEKEANSPIMISQDRNEFEFLVKHKSKKVIFKVNDTASKLKKAIFVWKGFFQKSRRCPNRFIFTQFVD